MRCYQFSYPKKLIYTSNADIIHCLIANNTDAYKRILISWIGFSIDVDYECEAQLSQLISILSENAVFKLVDGDRDVIFNQNNANNYSK